MILLTNLIPSGFSGLTVWPFILIRPDHANDTGLIEHERVHWSEQWRLPVIWWLLYLIDRNFRVAAEVRAYRVSMEHGMPLDIAARWLMRYDSRLSIDGAMNKLKG